MLKSFTAMSGCASRGTINLPQEVHIINLRGHEAEGASNTFPEVSQHSSFPKCFCTFNKRCAFYSVARSANYHPKPHRVDRRGRIQWEDLQVHRGESLFLVTAVWKAAGLDLSLWFCCWCHTETVSVRVRRWFCCTRMSFRVSLCLFSKFPQWTFKKRSYIVSRRSFLLLFSFLYNLRNPDEVKGFPLKFPPIFHYNTALQR